jgi:hypothetical protein
MSDNVKILALKRGGNYQEWATQMEGYLVTLSLEAWLEKEPDLSKSTEVGKDKQAKARLLLAVSGGLLEIVRRASNTKEAWTALRNEHLGELKVQRPRVLGKIVELQQGRDSIIEYIDRAKLLRDQMEDLELKDSLPMLSHQFVRGLNDHLRLSCGPYLNKLLSEGKELDHIALELHSIASIVQRNEAKVNVSTGQDIGKGQRQEKGKKEKRRCHHCGKAGHLKKDCWELNGRPPSTSGVRGRTENAKVSVAKMQSSEDSNACDLWFDTGATHLIVCDRMLVHDLQVSHVETVVLGGGGEKHPVLGQGKMIIEGGSSGCVNLNDALFVPSLKLNLCSGVQVTAKGAECWQGGR